MRLDYSSSIARLHERHPGAVPIPSRLKVIPHGNDDGKIVLADPATGRMKVSYLASTTLVNCYGFRIAREAWLDEEAFEDFNLFPAMLGYHSDEMPIGRWERRGLEDDGFFMSGFISAARPEFQTMAADGTISGVSVAVEPREMDMDAKDGYPICTKLRLREASLVPIPGDKGVKMLRDWYEKNMAASGTPAGRGTPAVPATLAAFPELDDSFVGLGNLEDAIARLNVAGAAVAVSSLSLPKGESR